jgi:hypothetical protein
VLGLISLGYRYTGQSQLIGTSERGAGHRGAALPLRIKGTLHIDHHRAALMLRRARAWRGEHTTGGVSQAGAECAPEDQPHALQGRTE